MIEIDIECGLQDNNWRRVQDQMLEWCRNNCREFYCLDLLTTKMRWSFKDKSDAAAFKLRWI